MVTFSDCGSVRGLWAHCYLFWGKTISLLLTFCVGLEINIEGVGEATIDRINKEVKVRETNICVFVRRCSTKYGCGKNSSSKLSLSEGCFLVRKD